MKLLNVVLLLAITTLGTTACQKTVMSAPQQPPAAATPQTRVAAPAGNPNQAVNDRFQKELSSQIAGKESQPAEQVFKNIQWLKGVPAGQFLRIMNGGYSRALGVSCTHCHVEQDFASDEKRPKRAAREMAVMHRAINEQLKKMENLKTPKTENRAINCATCHRGMIDPRAAG